MRFPSQLRNCPILILQAVFSLAVTTLPASAWYPFSERYTEWQANRPLTYGAYHNATPKDHVDDRMARFKAAGLNTFVWIKPQNGMHFFEAAHEQGVGWITGLGVPSDQIPQEGEEWAESLRVPALDEALAIGGCSGIIVTDEPNTRSLTPEQKDRLFADTRGRIDWVRTAFPEVLSFANLSFFKIDRERYLEECQPDVFCYDMYPLLRGGETHSNYCEVLHKARSLTMHYRIPFWMILQSFGREGDGEPYRLPGEADERFLAFSLLAHGGCGMLFFIYHVSAPTSEDMITDYSTATHSDLREKGAMPYEETAPTRSYDAIRDMAPEIQVLGRTLLQLRPSGEIGYAGVSPDHVPAFEVRGALKQVSFLEKEDAALLFSFFDDRAGNEYFMVVNCKHGANLSKHDAARWVRLTFGSVDIEKVERLNRLTGRVEVLQTKTVADERVLDILLPGGTGDLFKWHDGKPWDMRPPPGE